MKSHLLQQILHILHQKSAEVFISCFYLCKILEKEKKEEMIKYTQDLPTSEARQLLKLNKNAIWVKMVVVL